MDIDAEDTLATVRLKLRIRDLELENMVLRDKAGAFDGPRFTQISDLKPISVHDGSTEIRLLATWEAARDPATGKLHALGVTHTPAAFRLSYFYEDAPQATRSYQENALMEIHKRLIRELAAAT